METFAEAVDKFAFILDRGKSNNWVEVSPEDLRVEARNARERR